MTELVGPPATGRVFAHDVRPGLTDVAPSGRVRLDALARWAQDVAYADVLEAGLAGCAAWVVRRMRIRVQRFPRFEEPTLVRTFASGMGRMWAERRTTIVRPGADRPDVEAVALWIHLAPDSGRPTPLSAPELEVYLPSTGGRLVKARLHHPAPQDEAERLSWHFRACDLDLAGHVNNAAYWQPLEEELLAGEDPSRIDAEIEFRSPAWVGTKTLLRSDGRRWLAEPSGELLASMVLDADGS